ncbi:EF-P 5-aminopentanol modification-associated protein YfmH [Companilactobacillus mishanensis]|uniref:EF-P 5-aminopentanol modification-associated protein YfmH n=1 Tax=Companilactobacillus mishanensis TaxID=2486008 RepID=UPI00129813B8|nr:pitrilysin family protein [Companilactobacillus mishanensis]MQS88999.1 insulinase family protein [Companilactobacillus mishanensis]
MAEKLQKFTKKLANGFEIEMVPLKGYKQIYSVAMANFGSVNTKLADGSRLPAGIAHFIEHKLFAKPGYDISEKFAEYGANSNAYTSYTKTAYLFQTLENPYDNLKILLDLFQHPHFTEENVASERGIINQEIQMYLDMPEWVLEQRILEQLYPGDPIAADIAGSTETLQQINAKNLLDTYRTNYRPDNMSLAIVGDVDFDKVVDIVEQSPFETDKGCPKTAENSFVEIGPGAEGKMNISQSRSAFGIRVDTNSRGYDLVKLQYILNMIMETLIGESSENYQDMTNKDIIDDSFSYNVVAENDYCFIIISGSTNKPEEFQDYLRKCLLDNKLKDVLTKDKFERIKRDAIGAYLFAQNSPDAIANQMAELYFYDVDYLQLVQLLDSISLDEVLNSADEVFQNDNFTYYNLLADGKD